MGFCIFNNVAIGAQYAKKKYKLNRMLILDWDVHHGNGIQEAFYDDPGVMYVSIHEENYFPPGSGKIEELGNAKGKGYNINIPLPPGSDNIDYSYVMEQIVLPLTNRYQPELIMVAAGQDANIHDPMGRMAVSSKGFRKMTEQVLELAAMFCQNKLVLVQEGGYSLPYTPICTLTIIEALSGFKTDFYDPFMIAENESTDNIEEIIKQVRTITGLSK